PFWRETELTHEADGSPRKRWVIQGQRLLMLARVSRVGNVFIAEGVRISVYVQMNAGGQGIGLQAQTEYTRIVGLNFVPGGKVFDPQSQASARIDYELDLVRREILNADIKGAAGPVQPPVLFVIGSGYYHITAKFLTEPVLEGGKPLLE